MLHFALYWSTFTESCKTFQIETFMLSVESCLQIIWKTLSDNEIRFRLWERNVYALKHSRSSKICKMVNKWQDEDVNVDDSYQNYFSSSWDNGDTEKMSPWDMEMIPDDGGLSKTHPHTLRHTHNTN